MEKETLNMTTEYAKDDLTGLSLRIEQSVDEKGEVRINVEVANDLRVIDGKVFAMPFEIPKTPEEIERQRRADFIFGVVEGSSPSLKRLLDA